MIDLHSLRGAIVDSPNSIGARYRQRRWAVLQRTFPNIGDMCVLDLGGRAQAWLRAPVRPRRVHVVNLEPIEVDLPDWINATQADACELPAAVTSTHYDLVYSNAVIEHVGGHAKRLAFAEAVRKAAPQHWVQTPYRYFPIEPHWLFPWFQHLPVTIRASISQHWPLMHTPSADRMSALAAVMQVELVSLTEMRYYFPDSNFVTERVGPLVKSIVAVRTNGAS